MSADQALEKALPACITDPLAYDLSEMCPEADMLEMAEICEHLRKELYRPEGQLQDWMEDRYEAD